MPRVVSASQPALQTSIGKNGKILPCTSRAWHFFIQLQANNMSAWSMSISKSHISAASVLHQHYPQPYYWDAHEAQLHCARLSIHEIYLGIFSHYPSWAKTALAVRGNVGKIFGIKGPTFAELDDSELRATYRVGEKIGRFTLHYQSENEIITGENDRHLDFRVSVMKIQNGETGTVVLSTVVQPRNLFGKIYLLLIEPFHRFGIRMLLSNAANAKRI